MCDCEKCKGAPEKFLSAKQLAEALGISRETLRQMVLAGTVTGYRAHPKARPVYLLSESHAAVKARPCSHSDTARRFAEAAVLRLRRAKMRAQASTELHR